MDALARKVGERLKAARAAKLVTAESCTGGWAAQVVTSVAEVLGLVRARLRHLLERGKRGCSASQETLRARRGERGNRREMAQGARSAATATVALAVTGVAGPGGGAGQPVGMVCFAWAAERSVRSETQQFRRPRKRAPAIGGARSSKGLQHLESG